MLARGPVRYQPMQAGGLRRRDFTRVQFPSAHALANERARLFFRCTAVAVPMHTAMHQPALQLKAACPRRPLYSRLTEMGRFI